MAPPTSLEGVALEKNVVQYLYPVQENTKHNTVQ